MQKRFIAIGIIFWLVFFLGSTIVAQFNLAKFSSTIDWILLASLYALFAFSGTALIFYGVKSKEETNKLSRQK